MILDEPPVRLCCLKRHNGTVCPDGKVMCCLCFDRFSKEELNIGPDGRPENVCRVCAEEEKNLKNLKKSVDGPKKA
jgi:hypothetical protein